jgi:Tfp pilus assembly protein PilO
MTRRNRPRFDLRRDLPILAGVLGGLLLLNMGFYFFLNMPRLSALNDLATGRDEVRRALLATSRRCEAMQELIRRYDEEAVKLTDFYDNRLGTQIDRMTMIQKEIRAVASEFRIDPESINYNSNDVEDSDLTRFQITIPLVGGYPNLRQFIDRLESSPSLFILDSIELAGSREGGAMLSLTIRISTYFRSPEPGRGAPPARRT